MAELWRSGPGVLAVGHQAALFQLQVEGPKVAFVKAKILTQSLEESVWLLDMLTWKEAHSSKVNSVKAGSLGRLELLFSGKP